MSGFLENLGKTFSNPFASNHQTTRTDRGRQTYTVPWGRDAFPPNGAGRIIEINSGDSVRFRAIDDEPHNVAEAVIIENEDDEYVWVPDEEPTLGLQFRTRENFDETITFNRAGVYHLVCPVQGHHRVMRLAVNVNPSEEELRSRTQQAADRVQRAEQEALRAEQEARLQRQRAQAAALVAAENGTTVNRDLAEQARISAEVSEREALRLREQTENIIRDIQEELGDLGEETIRAVRSLIGQRRFGGPLDHVDILAGTGTYDQTLPGTFNFAGFNLANLFSPNHAIGPLGPVVRRNDVNDFREVRQVREIRDGDDFREVRQVREVRDVNGRPEVRQVREVRDVNGRREVRQVREVRDVDDQVDVDNAIHFHNQRSTRRHHNEKRVTIPWNLDVFEDRDGQPRNINIPVGTIIHFKSADDRVHSVVESNAQFSPVNDPIIDTREDARRNMNELVTFNESGTYYFVGGEHPQSMRLVVNVVPISEDASNIIDGV